MHTLQIVLVDTSEVEDEKDMQAIVKATNWGLPEDSWSDWWEVGGRWQDYLTETVGKKIWPNQLENPVAIKLKEENLDVAKELLKEVIKLQAETVIELVDDLKKTNVDLNKYLLEFDNSIDNWQIPYLIKSILNMKEGTWNYNSRYFDSTQWSSGTNPKALLDYLEDPENNKDLWCGEINKYSLVVVDFHF